MTVITVNEIMSPIATLNVPNRDGNTGCALWCLNWDQPQFKSSVWFLFSSMESPVLCVRPLSPDHIMEILMDLVRKARSRNIGTLHPFFNINKCVRDGLQETLPDNVHQIISGKVYISLTRVSDGENVLVSEFHSKDEVVDVSILPLWVWSDGGVAQGYHCLCGLGPWEYYAFRDFVRSPRSLTMSGLLILLLFPVLGWEMEPWSYQAGA